MRFSEISSKEIVNITTGTKLGMLGHTDLEINAETGEIRAFILPNYKWFGIKKEASEFKINWNAISKIGEDMIMIEEQEG
ncbi:YlmC/YmxH family sporulation protein [Ornithinibacillus sp. 4-3]|uniref:YlmC/YmxH family sporulation protein n=1 Tax=Ornithinibacillus sp. 4-3 TaxID=3231488 RepID=A0AB39HUR6_9BACI